MAPAQNHARRVDPAESSHRPHDDGTRGASQGTVRQIQECRRRGHSRMRHPFRLARKTALRQSSNNESAGSQPASGRLAELFLKFRLDALLLEARQIVDEDFALEVIHFVLDADGEEFLCDDGKGSSV